MDGTIRDFRRANERLNIPVKSDRRKRKQRSASPTPSSRVKSFWQEHFRSAARLQPAPDSSWTAQQEATRTAHSGSPCRSCVWSSAAPCSVPEWGEGPSPSSPPTAGSRCQAAVALRLRISHQTSALSSSCVSAPLGALRFPATARPSSAAPVYADRHPWHLPAQRAGTCGGSEGRETGEKESWGGTAPIV